MAEFQDATLDASFKCNTCKSCFSSIEKIKDHYRTDWHILNSKRRSNNLLPLRKEEFKALVQQSNNSSVSGSKVNNPKNSVESPNNTKSITTKDVKDQRSHQNINDTMDEQVQIIDVNEGNHTDEDDEEEEWEDVDEDNNTIVEAKTNANISIFDDKEFETTEECVKYMSITYGFFIPDMEYLVDLDGFLVYLNEKVKVGGYCLYCHKQCIPGRPCQNHMRSKSHCKIAYEEGFDLEEFEDFYDFSSSYQDDEEELVDEDGNVIVNEATISSTGELVLADGRILGHRDYRVYYKQHHRQHDTRAPILAQQREELLKLGGKLGGIQYTPLDIEAMGEYKVMELLVKYQKEVRKGMMVEQRSRQHADWTAKRNEANSKVDKARSSELTTAKIRDYHKTVM